MQSEESRIREQEAQGRELSHYPLATRFRRREMRQGEKDSKLRKENRGGAGRIKER